MYARHWARRAGRALMGLLLKQQNMAGVSLCTLGLLLTSGFWIFRLSFQPIPQPELPSKNQVEGGSNKCRKIDLITKIGSFNDTFFLGVTLKWLLIQEKFFDMITLHVLVDAEPVLVDVVREMLQSSALAAFDFSVIEISDNRIRPVELNLEKILTHVNNVNLFSSNLFC